MSDKIVSTQYGKVSGVAADTEGIVLFKGVPIGADTAGANRFRAPQPAVCWDGVRACDEWGDRFLQETSTHTPGTFWGDEFYYDEAYEPGNSENGLVVNVYAPEKVLDGSAEKLPVFVYIHGGGFTSGYASEMEFNASRLAARNVVVVQLQYRLSALGWLALPELSAESEHGVSGNYTVLDLVHGLKWVRDNIAEFGGDPSKVTISGQSAGAMAVTCLLRTPLARGLFHAAIVQSGFNGFLPNMGGLGAGFTPLAEAEQKNVAALREIFGKDMTVAELRQIPTEDFMKPSPSGKAGMFGQPMTLLQELSQAAGNMVLDGYVFTEDSVNLLKPGNLDGIQIMIGGTSDEATSLFGDFVSQMGITPENLAERLADSYGEGCIDVYPSATKEEAEFSFMRAQSDQAFQKYLLSAELTEQNQNHETYAYYFHQVPPGRNEEMRGAYHSSELWYMNDSMRENMGQREWRPEDYEMARIMSDYWMNFVKYGNPNSKADESEKLSSSVDSNPSSLADERENLGGKVAGNLAVWEPCNKATGLRFMDLSKGTSHMAEFTENKERDLYHRAYLEKKLQELL